MPTKLSQNACLQAVITAKGIPTADIRDRARTASDLHMMIQHDGKERDADQWADILTKVIWLCIQNEIADTDMASHALHGAFMA